jgi:cysteine desulfurase family protein (TIGR01976 family)
VAGVRAQFPGLQRQVNNQPAIFLDGPGGSQVPQCVIDAVGECLAYRNANDGGYFPTSIAVGELMAQARQAGADLLGSDDPNLVVFGLNMTSLTMALSRALARTWAPGDEVILTRLDHDANVSPWVLAARDAGATVRFLEIDPHNCTLRLEQLRSLLNAKTRLVAVGVASNAVGTINPVAEMITLAHAVGALVYVDAVHGVPHLLPNVTALGADFFVCSPYKFFGPHQGMLWGHRELLERLQAYKVRPAPDTTPGRWMTGTASFEAAAGTLAAIDYLADLGRKTSGIPSANRRTALAAAYARIREHEGELTKQFLTGLARIPGYRLWGMPAAALGQRVSTFGITHERLTPKVMAAQLAEHGIFAWSGNFYAAELIDTLGLAAQGVLRVGFLHYNTHEEVDRLLRVLTELDRA